MTKKKETSIPSLLDALISEDENGNDTFSIMANLNDTIDSLFVADIPEELPILPLRNMVLFPTTVLPVSVGRKSSIKLIDSARDNDGYMAVFCQKEPSTDIPELDDLHQYGTIAKIVKILKREFIEFIAVPHFICEA